MNILVIAAHPDDELLGCGGTLFKLSRVRDNVFDEFIISYGRSDKRDQRFDVLPIRDFITAIENRIKMFKPDVIYTHHLEDMNKDHRIIGEATLIATRRLPIEVFGYEVFSASGSFDFNPDTYVRLDIEDVNHKIDEMKTTYGQELREYPHPRSTVGIFTLAKYRGMQANLEFAEAFKSLRRIIL